MLMDQPAESIDADEHAVAPTAGGSELRRLEPQFSVRLFFVGVPEILSEDAPQMAFPED
jgi:hypothetical protein